MNEFYNSHSALLNCSYKADYTFHLKTLFEAGAGAELVQLCNSPELGEWIKEQKVSGEMVIGERKIDFAVWTKKD